MARPRKPAADAGRRAGATTGPAAQPAPTTVSVGAPVPSTPPAQGAERVATAQPDPVQKPVEVAQGDPSTRPVEAPPADLPRDPALDALREAGAQRLDPARFRYLEALERRGAALPGAALQQHLARQLADAVAVYRARWDTHCAELAQLAQQLATHHPQAAAVVRRLQAAADLRGLQRLASGLAAEQQRRDGPLAQLLRLLDSQQPGGSPDAAAAGTLAHAPAASARMSDVAPMPELRTVQRFRDTWARLRLDEQLARSQQQAPENPGPLNSHLLVLRALRAMQDLSPAYLDRFVAQVEALMWLDGARVRKAVPPAGDKPVGRERGGKKGKAAQGRG